MKNIIIYVRNHFDLMWRRAFRREIYDNGKYYVSYAKLQELYIEKNLQFCREYPEYQFSVECPAVLRQYLRANPERLQEVRSLAQEGRLYVPAAGDNIIDSNMVRGESIVQNYVRGQKWLKETLGLMPKKATRMDAFGNSAQLPQILRGMGLRWVGGIVYTECTKPYWRGLDGSVVYTGNVPCVGNAGGWRKYAPCPVCHGAGEIAGERCAVCGGAGIDCARAEKDWAPIQVNDELFAGAECGIITVGGEELLPQQSTIDWAHAHADTYNICFGGEETVAHWLEKELQAVDAPPQELIFESPELNPNNTGCYVSRIQCKQVCRRQESKVLALQALYALRVWEKKAGVCPELDQLWELLLYTMFHDAITGTHVDEAYKELVEVWDKIDRGAEALFQKLALTNNEKGVTVFNLSSAEITSAIARIDQDEYLFHSLAPFSAVYFTEEMLDACRVSCEKAETYKQGQTAKNVRNVLQAEVYQELNMERQNAVIENEFFAIYADEHGIVKIWDRKNQRMLAEKQAFYVGEWLIEEDDGSPWATVGSARGYTQLSQYTRLSSRKEGSLYQRLNFAIVPNERTGDVISGVYVEWSVTLYKNMNRIVFHADVDWDCYRHRLRIAIPTAVSGAHRYEVPFGSLVRGEYVAEEKNWSGSNGDWPAVNWAGVETDEYSVALLNKGTPSYKIQSALKGDIIFLSVLRSPCIPTYLHEPQAYSMRKWDGMRDTGKHHFSYALVGMNGRLLDSNIVEQAEAYNTGLVYVKGKTALPQAPTIKEGGAVIAAIECGVGENSMQVRVVETHGVQQNILLCLPKNTEIVYQTDLQGNRIVELPVKNGCCAVTLRPFEIATVVCQRQENNDDR